MEGTNTQTLYYFFSVGIQDSGSKSGRKCRRRKGETQKLIDEKRLDPPGKDLYKTITIIGLPHKTHKNQFFFYYFTQIQISNKKCFLFQKW